MSKNKQEIWLIDDHQLFSAGMRQMLENLTQQHDIHCFNHPKHTIENDTEHTVALIIMDYYIPDAEPTDWIMHFCERYPQTPVIVISSSISSLDKQHSLAAGASAYYPKHASPQVIMSHLQAFIDDSKLSIHKDVELTTSDYALTPRQIDILIQLARGKSNKKIAQNLDISPETVKTHIAAIYKLIQCETRDQAIEWARFKGFM